MNTNTTKASFSKALLAGALLLAVAHAPAFAQAQGGSSNRPIAANDLVEIKVFQETELDTKTLVGADGTVHMPLIGSVRLAGRSVNAAAGEIRRLLLDGYLVNPQVTVNVLTFTKRTFTVLGQVEEEGTFELPENRELSLFSAIGLAGGFTDIANRKKVRVTRDGVSREYNTKDAVSAAGARAVKLRDGDVIHVPQTIF